VGRLVLGRHDIGRAGVVRPLVLARKSRTHAASEPEPREILMIALREAPDGAPIEGATSISGEAPGAVQDGSASHIRRGKCCWARTKIHRTAKLASRNRQVRRQFMAMR